MKKRLTVIFCVLAFLFFETSSLQASKSKPFKCQEDADCYLITHYNLGCQYYNEQEWCKASTEFEKVIYFFPCSETAAEASYYLAVCYFEMKEYDFANEEFSSYLKASNQPAFFEDAVYYKFCIAEYFKAGKKRRFLKGRYLPKWANAQDLALTIYDEVVAALPNHELTIQALYSKAELLKCMREYRDCTDTYQMIIRRFPKHEIVPACYLNIADAYVNQSHYEFQNPDLLALAELNARKFKDEFPRDERVTIAEDCVCSIKEAYAKGLCDLGSFYERMKQPDAAAIYYQSSIEEFPDTHVAEFCRSRLICLGYRSTEEKVLIPSSYPTVEGDIPIEKDLSSVEEASSATEQALSSAEEKNSDEECYLANVCHGEQDYLHYSLLKKREVRQEPCFPPQEEPYQSAECHELVEGEPSPYCDGNIQEVNSPYFLHYSQLKKREVFHDVPED